MELTETVTHSERLYEGRIVKLRVDSVTLPNGAASKREIIEHGGAIAVVPIDANNNVLLVRQFRLATGGPLLEIPAGGIESGEDPAEAAARELAEEIGFAPGKLTKLCSGYVAPGYCTELIHIYLAEQLTPQSAHTDSDEFVETVSVPLEKAIAMIGTGEIIDLKSISGLTLAARLLSEK
jgi:ADP-ribose pyrophosphatase